MWRVDDGHSQGSSGWGKELRSDGMSSARVIGDAPVLNFGWRRANRLDQHLSAHVPLGTF